MCGIIGCAGDLNVTHEKAMRTMLILDAVRGEDSTGIAVIGKAMGNVKIAKQVGDPFQLFDHKSFDKAFTGVQKAIIGHNRYATTGSINRQNAHPFENASVVGVHNGTLKSKWRLADAKDYVVDSENIYHHIDKYGLKDALQFMEGAWALVWWDKENGSINFLRNKERPLYMAWSKDVKVLYWASEPWMLYASLGRHNLDHQDIFQLDEDIHYSIQIDDKGIMSKPVQRAAPSTFVAPPPAPHYNYTKPPHIPNNVVEIKKEEPAPATVKKLTEEPRCDMSYLSEAKPRSIETTDVLTDVHGSKYIPCFDPLEPYKEIRLYAKPRDAIWNLLGCDIIGTITGWNAAGRSGAEGGGYYKVDVHSFKIVAPDEEEHTIIGPDGKFLNKEQFEKKYQQCDFCNDNLTFGQANRFTTAGECLCEGCSVDKAVLEVVNLK